ncbi:MAG: hypothetical protein Q7S58_12525 [Candidatus Binatus sp.]|uniref:hypothetical protein n=1 Tax=Candidatus Binatus sp. TaxID=2811406 RepID=UPI0027188323|nr:hypothetical protein [Candidatus Binatus sp.]MDO8433224.1 hypothetical protein [Candidatus Binatus sp.]
MKINCLSCGHNVDLDDAYAENYEGAIKCYACGATLKIKTEQGGLRRVHLCAPHELLERAANGDQSDNHHRGPELHGRARLEHADKIQ